jgi:membrane associated rhomboid family serine protease
MNGYGEGAEMSRMGAGSGNAFVPHGVPISPRSAQHDMMSAADIEALHAEIKQLSLDEQRLLRSDINHHEKQDIKEQFFHRKMQCVMQLPPEHQRRYHPRVVRMGTVRDNMNMQFEDMVEHKPYFVVTCFVINLIMFVVSMGQNGWEFESQDLNPMFGPSAQVLDDLGAKNGPKIIDDGEWWRLITPMFLHAGLIHLAMNMVVLMRLGWSMEVAFGTWRVAAIYLSTGLFGTLMSAIFLPDILGVGASGALFGLIGSLFGDFIQNHKAMHEGKCSYFLQLVISSAIGLAIGLFPLLDNFGHFGGWLLGIIAGMAYLAGVIKDVDGKAITTFCTTPLIIISIVLQILLFGLGTYMSFADINTVVLNSVTC